MKRELPWLVAVAAFHLWLVGGLPVLLLSGAVHDDALYLRSAERLAAGEWLGPYDNRTLARGPFFPAFVAAAYRLGVPLRVAESLAYLAAGGLLLWAAAPWTHAGWPRVAAFACYALNPILATLDQLRVAREGVYVPLTVLLLALVLGLLRLRDASLPSRAVVAGGLGLALGAFWLTREEGPWILPVLLVALAALVALRIQQRVRRLLLGDAGLLAGAALVALLSVEAVAWLNSRRYDTWCASEFRQDAFPAAYGALLRVDPAARMPFVPVTREALRHAAAAGPMTAEAVGRLEAGLARAWAETGCAHHGVEPCDGEVRAGWFMFALRDAAEQAGHYVSGGEAEAFYRRIAVEVDAACASGRLACGPPRRGFLPPLAPGDLAATLRGFLRGMAVVATFEGFALAPAVSMGKPADHERNAALVGGRVFPLQASQPPATDRLRFVLLSGLASVYRWLTPPLLAAAALVFAVRAVRAPLAPLTVASALLLLTALTRVAFIALVDATSLPILNARYLSPAYPALLWFTGLTLAGQQRHRPARDAASSRMAHPRCREASAWVDPPGPWP